MEASYKTAALGGHGIGRCLVPVVSVILFSMERVNSFYKAKFDRFSLHDTFWNAYGCVFMQGMTFKFRHTSMCTSLLNNNLFL